MNLGRQIHTLLKREPAVYIGGLGCFNRVHTPAKFDEKREVFLPPITFIEFDSETKEGYDFTTYVQQANQLERNEAEKLVSDAVSLVLDKVTQLGQVELDNLGQLIRYGNAFVFKPLDLSGFNYVAIEDSYVVNPPSNEAVDALVEQPIQEEQPVQEEAVVEQLIPEEPEEKLESTIVSATESPTVVEAGELVEPITRKSTSAWVYATVGLIAILLLGGLYYYSTYMQEKPVVVDNNLVVVEPQDSSLFSNNLLADSLIDSTLNVQDTSRLTLVPDSAEVPVEEEVATPVNHRYTIVIGTHKALAQAYEEAEAFNKDGHKSVRVITPNLAKNLKRVVWDTYATKEERDSALRYVRKHIKTDAWPDLIR